MEVKVKRIEHSVWKELKNVTKNKDNKLTKGQLDTLKKLSKSPSNPKRWQLVYSNDYGDKISMIHFNDMFGGDEIWEIFAYENPRLFSDVKRFGTKREAETFIYRLLEGVNPPSLVKDDVTSGDIKKTNVNGPDTKSTNVAGGDISGK